MALKAARRTWAAAARTERPGAGRVHVVGAGLSGLACAVALARRGVAVEVSDAAQQAGGRCRSYYDREVGAMVDNGNHFVFSGNPALHAYLAEVGGLERLRGPEHAEYAFLDRADGRRWTLRPNDGRFPWWIASPARRTPGATLADHLALVGLMTARPDRRVGDVVATTGPLWRGLVEPVLVGALNTEAADCSVRLAAAVVRETLAKGGRAYTPKSAAPTLASAFVDPALSYLAGRGATLRLGRRLRSVEFEGGGVARLRFADGTAEVGAGEAVVLALPAWVATELVPGVSAPTRHNAIINGHFRTAGPPGAPLMQGVLGGAAQWVFGFPERISTTTSAADALVDLDREVLARRLWADVVAAYGLAADTPLPAWQVVKEKRATFAATPEQDALRPSARTRWPNLILAGDWTDTGLPATIEGSVRSGNTAADLALGVQSG